MSPSRTRSRTGRSLAAALALGLSLGFPAGAAAQSYPQKPIHLVVPFAAGGITDVLARALGSRLTEAFGQQTVTENKRAPTARSAPNTSPNPRPTATRCW